MQPLVAAHCTPAGSRVVAFAYRQQSTDDEGGGVSGIETRLAKTIAIARRRTATWKRTCERVVAQVVGENLADPRRHRSVECVILEIPTRHKRDM
jgi:hypothetical protein